MLFCLSTPDKILPALLDGADNAFGLAVSLFAVYVLWSGIIALMEKSGISRKIAQILSPITRKLFPDESEDTRKLIAMNFSANLLGAGGAATPLGIQAVESMKRNGDKPTFSMMLFAIINVSSIQLIPTTIISLRAQAGASAPYDILVPSVLVSCTTTVLGVVALFLLKKRIPQSQGLFRCNFMDNNSCFTYCKCFLSN